MWLSVVCLIDVKFYTVKCKTFSHKIKTAITHITLHTEHTFTKTSQLHVGLVKGLPPLIIQGLLLSVDQDCGASVQNPLGGSLHNQQVARVTGVFSFMDGHLKTNISLVKPCLAIIKVVIQCYYMPSTL